MADGQIIIDTKVDSSGAEKGIGSLTSKLGGMAKGALAGITACTVAVGGLVTASISQYSQFEQLTGGVETLFKNSSSKVMEYANNAYKTAGMSANEYMSTITGFSASLLQGLGGDTEKAAEVGNKAVTDMSDNANKMGTSIENIQNAYQGFAKQNYTMLDNLKLGYGGTKTEMERLLTDAEKLTGIKYDINNFSDVIEAIHVVQEEMGITGTTAKEAMQTIEGSLNMTKSAWTNLLTGMADDNADFDGLINNLVESVGALAENLLPRIEIALNGVAQLIEKLLPVIAEKIPGVITAILPNLINAGVNVVTSLITGIQQNLGEVTNCIMEIATILAEGILTTLPQMLTVGMQIIASLASGIGQQLPTLIPLAVQCIMQLLQNFYNNMPLVIEAGMQLLSGLAEGIINAIPVLIAMLPQVIDSMLNYITTSLPLILEQGCNILLALIDGIVQAIPSLIAMLPQIIESIITFITENLPQIIDVGIQVLIALIDGLTQALPQLIAMLPQIIFTIQSTLLSHLPEILQTGVEILTSLIKGIGSMSSKLGEMCGTVIKTAITAIKSYVGMWFSAGTELLTNLITGVSNKTSELVNKCGEIIGSAKDKAIAKAKEFMDIGTHIINGIKNGIDNAKEALMSKVTGIVDGIKNKLKNALNIHSPSRWMRDMIGVNIVKGIEVGLDNESGNLYSNADDMVNKLKATVDAQNAITTSNYRSKSNAEAGAYNTETITNDNGINITIENFNGNDKQDIEQLAEEIAFLSKRNPV